MLKCLNATVSVDISTSPSEKVCGEILYYVLVQQSAYAFLRKFKIKQIKLCKDTTAGKPGQHLTVVKNIRTDPVLVPLSCVRQKMIRMNLKRLDS